MSIRTEVLMGTRVTIEVVAPDAGDAIEHAFGWFHHVERTCTRFDAASELSQLVKHVGTPVVLSPVLFEAIQFAVHVAHESGGAFDPTLGRHLHERGFNREHRSGMHIALPEHVEPDATFADLMLDPDARTVTLRRPLVLDLGAVAKGLAVDLAARELAPLTDFAVDAGGDLYVSGHNAAGSPWTIGIRHPRHAGEVIESRQLTNCAVCTSGDYERAAADGTGHHIIDPRSGSSPSGVASVTVIAPTAMAADALATAAFVLGPEDGLRFLERQGVEGVIFTTTLDRVQTPGWSRE